MHRCDVVITTRNRPEALARCLGGLVEQTVHDFGVIVVDDCSDSPLQPIVERFTSLDAIVVRLPQQSGPAAGRNTGVEHVTAEFVMFVDDDVVPDPIFVGTHLDAVTKPGDDNKPVVSFGPFVEPPDWNPTPWNLWEARQAKKEADAMLNGLYEPTWRQFHTGTNCLPTAMFRAVGGFDESFKRSEDDEFALRLDGYGCVFHFAPEAIAWHYSHRTLEAWLVIPRSYAYFDVQIDKLHPHEGYLAKKKTDLTQRRWPLRAARAVFRGRRGSRVGVSASVGLAKLLYRVGLVDPSMGLLSVAYDLSYVQSLREAESV